MEKIGEIVHLAKSGRLIVKIEENINHNLIGQSLIDIELRGPVNSPSASVIPTINSKYSIGGVVYKSHSLNHRFNLSKKRDRVRRKRT